MAGLHPNAEVHRITTHSRKITGSSMSSMQSASTDADIPIVMSDEVGMYDGSLTGEQQCFVLVEDDPVGVRAEDTTVQQLLTQQESAQLAVGSEKTVQMVQMDRGKTLEMMHVSNKDTVEVMQMTERRTVEVLQMDDGKTVEVVQMDGGKTVEVMHIDASKHPEVIHVDGSTSIELLSESELLKVPVVSNSSPVMFTQRKGKYLLSGQCSESIPVTPITMKRVITTQSEQNSPNLSLRSLTTVNPSIVLSTGKRNLIAGQNFGHIASNTSFPSSRKSQDYEASGLQTLTHMNSNIVLSGSKDVLSNSVTNLSNTIIISWPTVPSELENTVATQTEPCDNRGPSMNLFFCTFHADGSVQMQCDMPTQRDVSVSTASTARQGMWSKMQSRASPSEEEEDVLAMDMEGEEDFLADPRFSRSGRILKGKRPLKLESSVMDEDRDGDPDFELNGDGHEGRNISHHSLFYRKKRGRKKKRRLPSPDDFDEDLEFNNGDNGNQVDNVKRELQVKEELLDNDDELAMEILKTKGYSLRTKRRPKKLSDMHYIEEKVVKKRIERTQVFSCQMCTKIFPTFTRLQRHAKEEHDSTEFAFPCDLCGVVFTRPHNLERHKDTKHGDGERRFVCEICGRRFGRQDVLSVHISMVHLKKSLQGKKEPSFITATNTVHCTSCDKFFSKEQKLKEHRQGNLTCNDCSHSFECKTSLRVHQYKHHPTACNECGKVCDSKQQMYFHRLSHTPKFICKFCKKGFLWKSQYTVHMATHTGEKPVTCDICGKSFAHKLAVSKHKWQEHDENNKKFKCPTCEKSFVYKGKLQSHLRSHTGEKPFTCHHCPSTFSQRCNLTAHIKSVHGIYIQSIKSDGTTHTQLVKYKRAKKPPPVEPAPTVVNNVIAPPVETPVMDQPQVAIQEQVQMSESYETEAAVYHIVYAYPQ